jgi:hypothetical protein
MSDSDSDYEYRSSSHSNLNSCEDVGEDFCCSDSFPEDETEPTTLKKVEEIIQSCTCSANCASEKYQPLIHFVTNFSQMHKEQKRASFMTT